LVFWNLAGRVRLANKASVQGREQRVALLRDRGFTGLERWLTLRHGTGIGRDDLIDAWPARWRRAIAHSASAAEKSIRAGCGWRSTIEE